MTTTATDGAESAQDASRRRLGALAALVELSGGRSDLVVLGRDGGRWYARLEAQGGGPALELWLDGADGAPEAQRVLRTGCRLVLGEVSRGDDGLRLRLAWLGGLCDLAATDWAIRARS